MASALRDLPAVHRLISEPRLAAFAGLLGPQAVKTAVDAVLQSAREHIAAGEEDAPPFEALVARVQAQLERSHSDSLVEVINGTGILLHTNLGRAPLAREAVDAAAAVAGGYSNLELELESGARGSRHARVGMLLRELTGAEDGLVVNNCAAAVFLALDTFAKGREVVVSRNQLIEVGGGFRLPEILLRSEAKLVEVGTTNKVYLRDFARALTPKTALLMRTHTSNYRIDGFVADVSPAELAALGRRIGLPTLEDLGSGALVDLRPFGLAYERTVPQAIADGIDLVAFSGDKLLGGPQAGILVGKHALVARMLANPLLRALRVDKATLAALGATLRLFLDPAAVRRVPFYAMLALGLDGLRRRAESVRAMLGTHAPRADVVETRAYAGGGTLPLSPLTSAGLRIDPPGRDASALAQRLRRARPPVVGRVEDGAFFLDLRAIAESQDALVARALVEAFEA